MMSRGDGNPVPLKDLMGSLLAKYGYARSTAQKELEAAWRQAASDEVRKHAKLGALRRGVLEILVDNSAVLARLEGFEKQSLLQKLRSEVTHSEIRNLKFQKL